MNMKVRTVPNTFWEISNEFSHLFLVTGTAKKYYHLIQNYFSFQGYPIRFIIGYMFKWK